MDDWRIPEEEEGGGASWASTALPAGAVLAATGVDFLPRFLDDATIFLNQWEKLNDSSFENST